MGQAGPPGEEDHEDKPSVPVPMQVTEAICQGVLALGSFAHKFSFLSFHVTHPSYLPTSPPKASTTQAVLPCGRVSVTEV